MKPRFINLKALETVKKSLQNTAKEIVIKKPKTGCQTCGNKRR